MAKYRARCDEHSFVGPWRDHRNAADQDADEHRKGPGNHGIWIEGQQDTLAPKVQNDQTERLRINRAFYLSVFGLSLAALLVVILILAGGRSASDITSIVGLFTSVLGTIVGAFFGLQIGSSGKAKAEERADTAQKKADALQSAADEDTIKRAQQFYPQLFK
jgi:hypothetical protein